MILFCTVVWGAHRELFENYCLPAFLGSKNRKFIQEHDCVYDVFTTLEDWYWLEAQPTFQALKDLMKVNFIELAPENALDKAFRTALNRAYTSGRVFRPIAPDVIISNGSLENAYKPLKDGKKCSFLPTGGLRINQTEFMKKYPAFQGVESLELVSIFNEFMHPETEAHAIESEYFYPDPVQIISEAEHGLQIKSLFMQPLFLTVPKYDVDFSIWEWDLINDVCPLNDAYFIKDSDEAFEVSLTLPDYERNKWPKREANKDAIDQMLKKYMSYGAYACFEHGFRINHEALCLK